MTEILSKLSFAKSAVTLSQTQRPSITPDRLLEVKVQQKF